MIKAVYDANVVVAGLLNPDGLPAILLDLATQNRIQLVLSRFVLREYETVLRRPTLELDFQAESMTPFCTETVSDLCGYERLVCHGCAQRP